MSETENSKQIVELLATMVLKYIKEHPQVDSSDEKVDTDNGKAA